MPISKHGKFYCIGRKKKYRFNLTEKQNSQAVLLVYRLNEGQSKGYIWLTQDTIRHLQQLLLKNRADTLFVNSKFFKLKVEKMDESDVKIVLRNSGSIFLDYFWLNHGDIVDFLRQLYLILPQKK